LALGQLTPGPPVMLAAYVGYKTLGLTRAVIAAFAIFFPSFAMMFALLLRSSGFEPSPGPRRATGHGGGVIGTLAVALTRLAPHAVVDPFSALLFVGAVTTLLVWRAAPLKMVTAGGVLGIVRRRLIAAWEI